MKLREVLSDGKVITLCIHCDTVYYTSRGTCHQCGGAKEYDFFFSLSSDKREKLLDILNRFQNS